MEQYNFLAGIRKFGATVEEICLNTLGIRADEINENTIISPGWSPDRLFPAGEIAELTQASPLFQYRIWNILHEGLEMTYVRTGFGAPMVMDALLLLGMTDRCKRIIFVSSVGGLTSEIGIGDILLPEYSACGDGASRYLSNDLHDPFGEKQYPESGLFRRLTEVTRNVCTENNIRWHPGKTFCTDTIAAQYGHLAKIIEMGYNSVDMESAAAFKAANLLQIPVAAILNVSDNSTAKNKSLMTERSETDKSYRKFVAREIMPQIITETLRCS